MITAFHHIASGNFDLKVNLTKALASTTAQGLDDYDTKTKIKFGSATSKGVKWIVDGKEKYEIYSEGMTITGMVTPDFKKVVIVYPPEHPAFPSPNNAVIYNEDGTVYMPLTCPEPISDLITESTMYMEYRHQATLHFVGTYWKKNEKGDIVQVIAIEFDEMFEMRALNYNTGEFGDCLDTWRL